MTDITEIFRNYVKKKEASNNRTLGINKDPKTTNDKLKDFSFGAKRTLNSIIKLKCFLLKSRTNYLSPFYLLTSTDKIMNDEQRMDFEQYAEREVKQCRDNLEELKLSIGGICPYGQQRLHCELVCAYLERGLVECTKIYSEQKCLRYKCDSTRKKIGRLDNHEQRAILSFDANSSRRNTHDQDDERKSSISRNSNVTTTSLLFDQEESRRNEEESQIPSSPPSGSELRQLQLENKQLYHDVAQRSEEVRAIANQVVEIAQLQSELFENIFYQKDVIHQVDVAAVASNDDLAAAIIHIRDAIINTAQMRRWVIFFLIVMIFSLLFLDWYNV